VSPGASTAESLLELLDIEELDTDLYRGINETSALDWPALYGGQVAAQALRAASYTVPEGRLPNSLHGYFLRPGRGIGPDDLQESQMVSRFEPMLHIRPLPPIRPYGDEWPVPGRLWVRSRHPLPDDPIIHACALAYVSDIGSGFGDGTAVGVPRGGPSIDHALWFNDPLRLDDWVLLEMWPVKAGGARGLYMGDLRDQSGRLGAVLTQEILFRPPRPIDLERSDAHHPTT
jgi:acyl-CoA thioesterase II